MDTQLSSSVWIPTFYPLNTGYTFQNPLSAPGKQVIHSAVLPPQSVLVTTSGSHVLVQAPQQILPLVTSDPSTVQVQSCLDPMSHNLIIHTPTVRRAVSKSTKHKHTIRHNIDDHNSSVNRTQKKKKVSPSAKRRSRLRLKAFLEAKKSASITEEESAAEKNEEPEPMENRNLSEGTGIHLENTNHNSDAEKKNSSSPSPSSATADEELNMPELEAEVAEKIAS